MTTKTPTYYALVEACALDGCPVCRLVQNSVHSYLDSFFYESVNDIQMRGRLRSSLGYCHEHIRMMLEMHIGDPLSFSIIYQDILGNVLRGLPDDGEAAKLSDRLLFSMRLATGGQSKQAAKIQALLAPPEKCLACREQESSTQVILKTLVKSITEPKMLQAVAESQGICLPHANQTLQMASDPDAFAVLVRLTRQNLEALIAQLAEFIRKNDHRFAGEKVGKESDAWLRALRLATGNLSLK
jgi:hypothetical protein